MKKLKRYKVFESIENKVDVEFIKDCFMELEDDGVPVKVEAGELFGHSSVTVTVCYWKHKFIYSNNVDFASSKNKVIDNLIKDSKEQLDVLNKVNDEIDRILETFDYKVSISDYLYNNDDPNDPFYTDSGLSYRKKLEITFVKMKE